MFKLRHLTYEEYFIELCMLFNEKDYETEGRKERKNKRRIKSMEIMRCLLTSIIKILDEFSKPQLSHSSIP